MAEECDGNSVATSTSTPLNWWYLQANYVPSWNNNTNNAWNNQTNPNSSSSCEEDISVSTSLITNASNHSTHTVESSRRFVEPPARSSNELMAEHGSDNHLWSHVLLGVGSNNNQEIEEKFVDALSSKSMSNTMFEEPACDYLKKLDTNWDHHYSDSTSFNTFEKHLNGYSDAMIENNNERLTKLSNLVTTWSIAPPDPEVNNNNIHFVPQTTNNMSLNSSMDHSGGVMFPNFYGHDMRVKQQYHASEVPEATVFGKSSNTNGYQNGFNSLSSIQESGKLYNLPSYQRNFSDLISFNNRIRNNDGKGEGTAVREVKKKRCEESSETMLKKPKKDTSTASSTKVQAPKDKLADKITALQQIVSPFGKTDQASVLFEAIGYIKILQEEVQLLSNPYLKNNSHKDPWGRLDRKDKEDTKHDLRSKGLCLVPTLCTPLAYREISGPDYWTPAYRGCLYR